MRKYLLFISLLSLSSETSLAITVVQCSDANGQISFRDSCPVGMTKVGEKKLPGKKKEKGPDLEKISQEHPITFYAIPACDACDLVRNYLKRRGFPFTEVDASNDIRLQARLKEIAGSLTVPVIQIDDAVIKGYNNPALDIALDAAGYPKPEVAAMDDTDKEASPAPTEKPQKNK